jgi:hypothetical protein
LPFLRTPKVILTELDEEEDFFAIFLFVYMFCFNYNTKIYKIKTLVKGWTKNYLPFIALTQALRYSLALSEGSL